MSYVLCVSGSRDFDNYELMERELLSVIAERGRPMRVAHGGAPGADSLASRFAYEQKLDLDILGAQWGTNGSAGGPMRNVAMADRLYVGDVLVAFPTRQSRGTRHMVSVVNAQGRADIKVVEEV